MKEASSPSPPAPRSGAAIAIDVGEKKHGFAVADPTRIAREPLAALHTPGARDDEVEDSVLAHVEALCAEREVAVILVSLPLHADGSDGTRAGVSRRLAARLRERLPGVEIRLHDEHLTTREAEARLHEAGRRGRAAKELRDSESALVLLEDWIAAGEPPGPGPGG